MTTDDIIYMANEAGITPWTKHEFVRGKGFSATDDGLDGDLVCLVQFAHLIAAFERELCAKVAEKEMDESFDCCWSTARNIARDIRLRGEKE